MKLKIIKKSRCSNLTEKKNITLLNFKTPQARAFPILPCTYTCQIQFFNTGYYKWKLFEFQPTFWQIVLMYLLNIFVCKIIRNTHISPIIPSATRFHLPHYLEEVEK